MKKSDAESLYQAAIRNPASNLRVRHLPTLRDPSQFKKDRTPTRERVFLQTRRAVELQTGRTINETSSWRKLAKLLPHSGRLTADNVAQILDDCRLIQGMAPAVKNLLNQQQRRS